MGVVGDYHFSGGQEFKGDRGWEEEFNKEKGCDQTVKMPFSGRDTPGGLYHCQEHKDCKCPSK